MNVSGQLTVAYYVYTYFIHVAKMRKVNGQRGIKDIIMTLNIPFIRIKKNQKKDEFYIMERIKTKLTN